MTAAAAITWPNTSPFAGTRQPSDSVQQSHDVASLYTAYFGLGHQVRLKDQAGVFRVSLAGMTLGAYLLRAITFGELAGRSLELGTGSGVLALLLRSMGASDITATDVSTTAVALARENEQLNFNTERIAFGVADLFDGLPRGQRYDLVVFNPPGWRTPSAQLIELLAQNMGDTDMAPEAMFFGDDVLLRFLQDLPARLAPGGRAVIGLNSLVGIRDVLDRYRSTQRGGLSLTFRLLERHTFPLLFYSPAWERCEPALRQEFNAWRDLHGAAYSVDNQDRVHWSYEVVECTRTA